MKVSTILVNDFSLFIHSGHSYSASSNPITTQRRSRHSTDTLPEFHAEASQAIVSYELAQGPYVAAIGSRSHDPSDERRRLYQCATHFPQCPTPVRTISLYDTWYFSCRS